MYDWTCRIRRSVSFLEHEFPPVGSLGTLPLGIAHRPQFPGCREPVFEAPVCMKFVFVIWSHANLIRLAKEAGGGEKGKLSGPYISPNLHVEILPPTLQ